MRDEYARSMNEHYGSGGLDEQILAALREAGKDVDKLTQEDIANVGEFHVRGREATRELARLAGLCEGMCVLDIGCGVGGPARTLASEFGCRVTGIDLVEEYVRCAEMLTARVGLSDRVDFRRADAREMPFEDETFDALWTQHALMNVEDKAGLFLEIHRVLRPVGRLTLYEAYAGPNPPPIYPTPWASDPSISFLVTPEEGRGLLKAGGFAELAWLDVTGQAVDFFRRVRARAASRPAGAPSPLGPHLVMGLNHAVKVANLTRNLEEGRIVLVESVHERGSV